MGNHGASWELAGVLLDGEGPKAGAGISTTIESVVPIWKHLSPFLPGPCLPVSRPLTRTPPDGYSVCALPAPLFPSLAPDPCARLARWMLAVTVPPQLDVGRCVPSAPGVCAGSAAGTGCVPSGPVELSAATGRAARGAGVSSRAGQRPWVEDPTPHSDSTRKWLWVT